MGHRVGGTESDIVLRRQTVFLLSCSKSNFQKVYVNMSPSLNNHVVPLSYKSEPLNKKLTAALLHNDVKTFRSLLKTEGWPRYSEWSDFNLMRQAIKHERKQIVHALLDAGCRIFKKQFLLTPLHLTATKPGWTDVVERLLKLGLQVADRTIYGPGNGNTAVHYAFFEYSVDLGPTIDLLLTSHLQGKYRQFNVTNKDNLSFFHIACTRPSLEVVKALLETDKDAIYAQDTLFARTALHFAVEHNQHEIADFLLQNGADVYKQNCTQSTPLHLALKCGNAQVIDLLLAYDKRRRNLVNIYGVTHFMVTCVGSNIEIVKHYLRNELFPLNLINSKVQKNLGDLTGFSPLHFAAKFGCTDTVELLLNEGANCCDITHRGQTTHFLASKQGHPDVYWILKDHCKIVRRCRELRAESPDFEVWGEDYEKHALRERVRAIKHLDACLKNLRSISGM